MSTRALMILAIVLVPLAGAAEPSKDLAGVWHASKSFVPEHRGTVIVTVASGDWVADLAGERAVGLEPAPSPRLRASNESARRRIEFEFPAGDIGGGEVLTVRLDENGNVANGQWMQPRTYRTGLGYTSPVHFEAVGKNQWRGEVVPIEDGFTFYLVISEKEDGTIGAFLRNPERNLGIFANLKRVEREGNTLRFIGTFMQRPNEQVFYEGTYDPDWDTFSVNIPNRGGTYDFHRVTGDTSYFYARGKNPPPYVYTMPPAADDGWKVGSLDKADIALAPLEEMIEEEIDPEARSVHAYYVHGVLIARHGKLVFEEYFHGFHRDLPHDTRSASKSLTAVLVGAAIEAGYPIRTASPVYETIYGDELPQDLDGRKYDMTLEHLLTMTSGFYCDDRDPDAPGNEDVMQSQEEERDWYRYTLALPMASAPGDEAIYCSVNSNLIGNVLIAATGQRLQDLFQDLIAGPLELGRYYLQLQPTGEPYMGGGIYWLPRDFMKLGQLMIDDGVWNGKRVVGKDWAKRSIARQVEIRERGYGYAWWIEEYPYEDRTITAFLAGGNGGQIVVGVPELDLVIAFYGGNYSDRVLYRSQNVLVPEYILKAVALGGR